MSATNFRRDIESFLKATGLSATRFGVLAAGDTKFVRSIRKGRQVRPITEKSIRDWMSSYAAPR